VWIIDESSMIGDEENKTDTLHFGSGRLLSDLLHYLRLDRTPQPPSGAQIIFVGDPIQLPPVGSERSALDLDLLTSMISSPPVHLHLNEVHRQAGESGVLSNATRLRDSIEQRQLFRAKIEYNTDVMAIDALGVYQKLIKAYRQNLSCATITYSILEMWLREYSRLNTQRPDLLHSQLLSLTLHFKGWSQALSS
jgi:ATP-dependent exoDNAse (exonuclease V) alpha subunit